MIPKNFRVYLYNTTINDLICLRCSENYTTNENKTKCIYCGDECKYGGIDFELMVVSKVRFLLIHKRRCQ